MQNAQPISPGARTITSEDVSVAESAFKKAKSYCAEVERLQSSITERREKLNKLLRSHERLRRIRRFLHAWATRGGGLVLGIVACFGFVLVALHAIGFPPFVSFIRNEPHRLLSAVVRQAIGVFMRTDFSDLLRIEHPIVAAPMGLRRLLSAAHD
jgi:hypothetical protein